MHSTLKRWSSISCWFLLFLLSSVGLPYLLGAQSPPGQPPQVVESSVASVKSIGWKDFFPFEYQMRLIGFLLIISLVPFTVMMVTSFTRISIVFHFLRQALGSQQVPSNQIVIGLSLILTGFIMFPVIKQIQETAITPYTNQEFQKLPEVQQGLKSEESILIEKAWAPLQRFLLQHTREQDLSLFLEVSNIRVPVLQEPNTGSVRFDLTAIPWYCLVPAFVMSELRLAFMMGFLLFLPFLIIDMVVSSILMSMGMMMLPPMMVSTPFKLLLFIIIDGWRLIVQQMIYGFHPGGYF